LAAQNTVMQLRKICQHPFLFRSVENGYRAHLEQRDGADAAGDGDGDGLGLVDSLDIWRCSGKFELLDRMLPKLRRSGHRALLFSQFTNMLTILEDYLHLRGVKYLRLDGEWRVCIYACTHVCVHAYL